VTNESVEAPDGRGRQKSPLASPGEPLPERWRCTRLASRMRGRIISWTLPRRNNQVPAVVVDSEKKRMLPTTNQLQGVPAADAN